ncbi:WXG100 family type VII secretion target [Candidatus Avoscillospira sp. LCP25S3_F1]|uniref:WXG100 family type VII secretion target n=1 Tax=Candidatus Avoscillospira sp. LCP25S3_F1 TaxID=3438825 RepID=UPI003F8FA74D
MTGTLRVTPEKLIATAQSFNDTAGKVQNLTNNMLSTVQALNSTWAGEAATAYYNRAQQLQDSINRMVRMINEHATDLQSMAQNYQAAEQSAQEAANTLQTNIIV